jgi:hypothetical protein
MGHRVTAHPLQLLLVVSIHLRVRHELYRVQLPSTHDPYTRSYGLPNKASRPLPVEMKLITHPHLFSATTASDQHRNASPAVCMKTDK